MIREDRFVMSHRPYAVDLASLRVVEHPADPTRNRTVTTYSYTVRAVWFRRKNRVTVACIGTLWDISQERVDDAVAFLDQHDDGRYGGTCAGRWDGAGYWGEQDLDEMAAHLDVLRPMLDGFPAIPDGFDGWYTFARAAELRVGT